MQIQSYLQSPCKNCDDRCLYCHSSCSKYKDFTDVNEKIKENRRKEHQCNDYYRTAGFVKEYRRQSKKYRGGNQ